eukprot:1278159-Prymnesium_polylepis.1
MGVDAKGVALLPRIEGDVGNNPTEVLEPVSDVSTKGGTVAGGFLEFVEKAVEPTWPDMAPDWEYYSDGSKDSVGDMPIKADPVVCITDMGPGRLVADEAGLLARRAKHEKGFLVYSCTRGSPTARAVANRWTSSTASCRRA